MINVPHEALLLLKAQLEIECKVLNLKSEAGDRFLLDGLTAGAGCKGADLAEVHRDHS